jgi:hypothetical protein
LAALGLAGDSGENPSRKTRRAAKLVLPVLPDNLFQHHVQETPHWMGNLNVHVAGRDVERHLAQALRVYPGRLNLAQFIVGWGRRDAYAFRLEGSSADWAVKLFDIRKAVGFNGDELAGVPGIALGQWIGAYPTLSMMLALRPPMNCSPGSVHVHVTQRSTERIAVVEFSLDPQAAGQGCYVV